ncbi:MAG TPA: TolC family protein [Phycisphaerae bacterium]|jgi:outer membrane protein TolC|nr:TolC family protein [Phycisphaerae bacterium]HOB75725.1 TolC family protein [Phycisphaerae bacterium]HOJ56426.1 TolC family protein [Phycisphaerae bacterium]HOL28013.1 TolC family protein [Phycisphaerae bacterium]HPP22400.1 TolC family protein [Phycisphaerae bacterium]
MSSSSTIHPPIGRRLTLVKGVVCAVLLHAVLGCSSLSLQNSASPVPAPTTQPDGAYRRQILERAAQLAPCSQPAGQAASQPASQPAGVATTPACQLNPLTIIKLVYELSPQVRSHREAMEAAEHGLEEFRANLSRFEPFTEANGQMNRFPERQDSRGTSGEFTAGLQKETFEGAIFRIEGGGSASRVRIGEPDKDQDSVDEGSGGLIRGRIEVPFVGSRRRQERIISSAFQESTARQARLNYLDNYRTYAVEALQYYELAIYYLQIARAYNDKIEALNTIREDPRVRPGDLDRLDTTIADSRVYHDQYMNYHRDAMLSLLARLGLDPETSYVLEEPSEYTPSKYIEMSATSDGLARMVQEAYTNNPRFRVLDNAIENAELQRRQAIQGTLDITAYLEGTQFAFGAESFDDRVGGWQVQTGVTVRLNDQRVLKASRLKAEAQIRQYKAEIEAERLDIQREITTRTATLRSNHKVRAAILDNIRQKQATFKNRSEAYLAGESTLSIDDVLIPINELAAAEVQLAANRYSSGLAEVALTAAMGEVYRNVGMKMDDAAADK